MKYSCNVLQNLFFQIPVYQKGGTIVPRKERIRRSSSLTVHDPYTLVVCLDNAVSIFTL